MKWLFTKITDISQTEYQEIYNSLSQSRKAHIDRMKIENDRLRSLAATKILNKLLCDFSHNTAILETDPKGKPYLNGSDLFFSISHSDTGVVCAVSEKAVGIDIEKIRPVNDKLIDYVCNEAEKQYVLSDKKEKGKAGVYQRFFEVWTAKEAFFKKQDGAEKSVRAIDTLSLQKSVYITEDFLITVLE